MQSRRWCWTINNYTEDDLRRVSNFENKAEWAIYGKEVGSEKGTPHLQGYFYLKKKTTLTGVKKILPRANFQIAKGTHEENRIYCSKEANDVTEYGTFPMEPGAMGKECEVNRWATARQLAKNGKVEEIDPKLYIQYYRTFKTIAKDNMQMPTDLDGKLEHEWWHGEPGTGKSRKAHADHPEAYRKALNKWWDGYQGEEVVIIDEVEKGSAMFGHLFKIWGDRYGFIGETKGSGIAVRPKKIIIISNYSIQEVFGEDITLQKAIERRFHQVHFVDYFN
jgi:hypothetical protein